MILNDPEAQKSINQSINVVVPTVHYNVR